MVQVISMGAVNCQLERREILNEELIQNFHQMWDNFPGMVRLIDSKNNVLAVNEKAAAFGFTEERLCVQVGKPEIHRNCKKYLALANQEAQVDRPSVDKLRGWIPVAGYPDVVVHFTLAIPDME